VSEADVEEMFLEVTLFRAFRKGPGRPAADFAHLTDATFRLSHLLQRFPQIAEMDLNPLKLFDEGDGGLVVDARIRV
jgi:acetyltransferase